MGDQLGALGKALATLPAPVGLLPDVGPLMLGQLPPLGEALATSPAVVTPALGMSPLVVGQVALLGERLPTLCAGVGTTKGGGGLPIPLRHWGSPSAVHGHGSGP